MRAKLFNLTYRKTRFAASLKAIVQRQSLVASGSFPRSIERGLIDRTRLATQDLQNCIFLRSCMD